MINSSIQVFQMSINDNDDYIPKVNPLNSAEMVPPKKSHHKKWDRERHRRKYPVARSKDRFKELTDAVEKAHHQLVKEKSPYRFCVYEEEGEVFIDLVLLNEKGKIGTIKKKNITNEEFSKWMEIIERGEGLFFDETI